MTKSILDSPVAFQDGSQSPADSSFIKTARKHSTEISFWEIQPLEHFWSKVKTANVYAEAHVLVLAFSTAYINSFKEIKSILVTFKKHNKMNANIIVLGLRPKDPNAIRQVKMSTVRSLLRECGLYSYIEADVNTGDNIEFVEQQLKKYMHRHFEVLAQLPDIDQHHIRSKI